MADASEVKRGTHVEMDEVAVKSVTMKDGTTTVTLSCPSPKFKATRREIDKITNAAFTGYVVLEGDLVEQETLGFDKETNGDGDG